MANYLLRERHIPLDDSWDVVVTGGGMQPSRHCFVISNIDEKSLAKGPQIHFYDSDSPIWQAVRSDKYPLARLALGLVDFAGGGIMGSGM